MEYRKHFIDAVWALLILALNFFIIFVAIFIYSILIQPGQSAEHYEQVAPGIASWSAPIGGGLLFFLVGRYRVKRNPERGAYNLVFATWVVYVILDIALGIILAPATSIISWQLMLSLGIALLGGLAGARLARSR